MVGGEECLGVIWNSVGGSGVRQLSPFCKILGAEGDWSVYYIIGVCI